jgi:hypothetical protein
MTSYQALRVLLLWLRRGRREHVEMPKLRVRRTIGHGGAGEIVPVVDDYKRPT